MFNLSDNPGLVMPDLSQSLKKNGLTWLVAIFFAVGATGFLLPATRSLLFSLTPLTLLLSVVLLLGLHATYSLKTVLVFISIYVLSFFVETIGVNYGFIFGHYQYGNGLGPKLFNTPLLIGANWLFLTYCGVLIAQKTVVRTWVKILASATFMLGYDLILEQVAAAMDMWHWQQGIIPIKNYVAWFSFGFIFSAMLVLLNIKLSNKIAVPLVIGQLCILLLVFILEKTAL